MAYQVVRRRPLPPPVSRRLGLKPGDLVTTKEHESLPVFAVANPGKDNEFIVCIGPGRKKLRFPYTAVVDVTYKVTPIGSHLPLAGTPVVSKPIVRRRR